MFLYLRLLMLDLKFLVFNIIIYNIFFLELSVSILEKYYKNIMIDIF